jgi:hypothetical protein
VIRREGQVTDEYDRPVPGASIYVFKQDGTDATLTSDGTSSLEQPVSTDEFGVYSYYADEEVYREDTWYGGKLRFREVVMVGSPGADLALRGELAQASGESLIGGIGGLLSETPRPLSYGIRAAIRDIRDARIALASLASEVVGYAKQAGVTGGQGFAEYYVDKPYWDASVSGSFGWALAQAKAAGGGLIYFDPRGQFDFVVTDSTTLRFNDGEDNITVYAPGRNVTIWSAPLSGTTVLKGANQIWKNIVWRSLVGPMSGDWNGTGIKAEVGMVDIFPQNADKLAFIGCEFRHSADGLCDQASTGFTTGSSPYRATFQNCIFWDTDEAILIGQTGTAAGTTSGDTRLAFVTFYNCVFAYCGQRQPKALGLAMVHMVDCYTLMGPWYRDQPAPAVSPGACAGAAVQGGGWLLAEGCLWSTKDGNAYKATNLVANPTSGQTGYLNVVDCAAENGCTFDVAGTVAAPSYTLAHTPVPAAGSAREAWVADRWATAGARPDAAPDGLFVWDAGATDDANGETALIERGHPGRWRLVEGGAKYPVYPIYGDNADATPRGYTRTVGYVAGKASGSAIGATMLDLANLGAASYFGVQGNGAPATLKSAVFSDDGSFRDGQRLWLQGTASAAVTIKTATSGTVTATAATDTISHAGHGELVSGFPVLLSNSGGAVPAPLAVNTTYYGIYVDANSYKLAATYSDAIAGTAIDLTDAGSGSHTATIGSFNLPNGLDVVLDSSSKVASLVFNTGNQRFSVVSKPLPRAATVAAPTGGTTVDAEGRAATTAIIAALQAAGLMI